MRPDYERRTYLYTRYSAWAEWPLMGLALVMVANLLLPDILGVSTDEEGTFFDTIDWVIYGFFLGDFIVKIYLAPSIIQHLKKNWLDVVILALPLLRPLRILRSARLFRLVRVLRLVTFALRAIRKVFRTFNKHHFAVVAAVALFWVVASAGLVDLFEHDGPGNIHTYLDSLWWALATVTTVGYGDATPVTIEGRIVAVGLMLVGIAFYGILTANIAAYFVQIGEEKVEADIEGKLDMLLARMGTLENAVSDLTARSGGQVTGSRSSLPTPSETETDEVGSDHEPVLSRPR